MERRYQAGAVPFSIDRVLPNPFDCQQAHTLQANFCFRLFRGTTVPQESPRGKDHDALLIASYYPNTRLPCSLTKCSVSVNLYPSGGGGGASQVAFFLLCFRCRCIVVLPEWTPSFSFPFPLMSICATCGWFAI
jgi:hypothetical protein